MPKSEVEITVTVPADKLAEYREKACALISEEVKIKGFRPGKVPYDVLVKHVGEQVINQEASQLAIQNTYADVVIKEKINVISRPKIEIKEEGETLVYVAKVAVLPDVELEKYDDIKVEAKSTEATEKEMEEMLNNLRRLHQTATEIDGPAQKGHRIEIDFEGFDDGGAALENTQSKNHPVVIGEGTMIPGFEDALIGMKKGEAKEFEVTFPAEYHHKPFQNKKVKFKVEAKMIEEMNTPELSEEIVEKITGKKTSIEDFKKEVKMSIESRKKEDEYVRQEGQFIEELIKRAKIELPESLIEEEVSHMIGEMKHELEHKRKITLEDFLAQNKKTMEDLQKEYRPEAEKRIRARLVINHVIDKEGIDVDNQELEKEIEGVLALYPAQEKDKIEKHYKSGEARSRLKNRLKLDKLFKKYLPALQ